MSKRIWGCLIALFVVFTPAAMSGGHTWDMREVFSNATGANQFIEAWEANGGATETGTAGHNITSLANANSFTIPANVPPPSSFRALLFATAAFAALPGAPTPDYIVGGNFFSTTADTVSYTPLDSLTFLPGQLPLDGLNSFSKGAIIGTMTPENYAGEKWAPASVPDGTGGTPVTVSKLVGFPGGQRLSVAYDLSTCPLGNTDHAILYGFGSQLPSSLGSTYPLSGARCGIGATSPLVWSGVPDPSGDASRLLWFLVVSVQDNVVSQVSTEGGWGTDSAGTQRSGPLGGASGLCSVTTKSVANTCGQ